MKKYKFLPLLLLFLLLFVYSCKNEKDITLKPTKPYNEILKDIETQKQLFKVQYSKANSEGKKKIILEARQYLFYQLTKEIFPSWYGTKWDFNGVTQVPREGKIACGYFVTTTFRDLGFDIPRVKWAQATSENMIKEATMEIKKFSGAKMEDVEVWIQNQEDAIYMVGLDNHTGYVYKIGNEIWFVHSSPYNKAHGVICELASTHNPLSVSGYRVFGKLLDDQMIVNWMNGKKY
jgi:hypothetical protein